MITQKQLEKIILDKFVELGNLDTQEVIKEVDKHGLLNPEKWDDPQAGFFDMKEYANKTAFAILSAMLKKWRIKMNANLTKKEYTFVWRNDSNRYATIVFQAVEPGKFDFTKCQLFGVHDLYDLEDWEFLGQLADEIKALCKQEGVTL